MKTNLRLPVYGKKTVILAFEFGLVLSRVASQLKVDLNEEMVIKAEATLMVEIRKNGMRKTALNFVPLAMTMLEKK